MPYCRRPPGTWSRSAPGIPSRCCAAPAAGWGGPGAGGQERGRAARPLGGRDGLAPEPKAVTLGPGDLLVLYTDGLAEALDARAEAFGYERIADLVRPGGTPQEVHDRILAAFDAHVGEEPLLDDLTLLVMAREGEAARPTDTASKVA